MSTEIDLALLYQTIGDTLLAASGNSELSSPIGPESRMGDPREWDSLSFVAVFTAVAEAFAVEVEDDDAIHFMNVADITAFLDDVS